MTNVDSIVAILAALAPGVISPGPNFLLVAQSAFRGSRSQAIACAIGVSTGALMFALVGVSGLALVMRQWPLMDTTLKLAGAAYLGWLGAETLRHARRPLLAGQPESATSGTGAARYFVRGLVSQLSNPKGIAIYASVFAAFLPDHLGGSSVAALLAGIFALEVGWYGLVALALGRGWARETYLRRKTMVDIGAGTAMLLISLRLLTLAL